MATNDDIRKGDTILIPVGAQGVVRAIATKAKPGSRMIWGRVTKSAYVARRGDEFCAARSECVLVRRGK